MLNTSRQLFPKGVSKFSYISKHGSRSFCNTINTNRTENTSFFDNNNVDKKKNQPTYLLKGHWNLPSKADVDALMQYTIKKFVPKYQGKDHNDFLNFRPLLDNYYELSGQWLVTPKWIEKSTIDSKGRFTGNDLIKHLFNTQMRRKKQNDLAEISNLLEPAMREMEILLEPASESTAKSKVTVSKKGVSQDKRVFLPHGYALKRIYPESHTFHADLAHRTAEDLDVKIDNTTLRVYIPNPSITDVIIMAMFQNFEPQSIQTLDIDKLCNRGSGSDRFLIRQGKDFLVSFPSEAHAKQALMKFSGCHIQNADLYLTHYAI